MVSNIKNVSEAEINKPGYCMCESIRGLFGFVIQMKMQTFAIVLI
ncbi:hypothetical protein [Citrobacter freundii]|uniref:Uncharacterized protein n=1 Tax=Citrobacter freundii TaxID=546 RepID=A0A7G2IH45_CITFR|nr:hypothetical protein [Citrobacter freundii]